MNIEKQGNDTFKLRSITTQHEITVTDIVHKELTRGQVTKEELLDFSLKFLLDREPNTLILSKFDINIISQYFPEYEAELLKTLD